MIDEAYIAILTPFWYIAMHYGLNPKYSFFQIINGSTAYASIYGLLFHSFYFLLVEFALVGIALSFLIMNSIFGPTKNFNLAIRVSIAVILPIFTLQLLSVFLDATGTAFDYIWSNAGINWSTGLLYSVNIAGSIQASSGNAYLPIIQFFFLSGYFLSISMLIITLELRQAIMIVLSILLPIISVFIAVPKLDEYTKRLWRLFIEVSVFPFITILAVYFAIAGSTNSPLQLAFLVMAAMSPLVLAGSVRLFTSGSLLGIANAVSVEETVSRASGVAAGLANHDFGGTAASLTGMQRGSYLQREDRSGIDWSRIYAKDLDYRKDY